MDALCESKSVANGCFGCIGGQRLVGKLSESDVTASIMKRLFALDECIAKAKTGKKTR